MAQMKMLHVKQFGRSQSIGMLVSLCALWITPIGYGQSDQTSKPLNQQTIEHAVSPQGNPEGSDSGSEALVYLFRHDEHVKNAINIVGRRKGGLYNMAERSLVFINRDMMAVLRQSTYAQVKVRRGPAVFIGTLVDIPSSSGRWASLPGCAGLDLLHLGGVRQSDTDGCEASLSSTLAAMKNASSGALTQPLVELCRLNYYQYVPARPGSPGHTAGYSNAEFEGCVGEMSNALGMLNQTLLGAGTSINLEAGKTYYAKLSEPTPNSVEISLVDEATGAKELRGLQPAVDK